MCLYTAVHDTTYAFIYKNTHFGGMLIRFFVNLSCSCTIDGTNDKLIMSRSLYEQSRCWKKLEISAPALRNSQGCRGPNKNNAFALQCVGLYVVHARAMMTLLLLCLVITVHQQSLDDIAITHTFPRRFIWVPT